MDGTPTTLSAGDSITGTAGTNYMNLSATGTVTDATNGALISGMQNLNFRNTGSNTGGNTTVVTLDASKTAGATAVNSNLSTGSFSVTKLAAGASVGIIGNGTLTNGGVQAAYSTATSAITLNLMNGVKQTAGNAAAAVAANSAGAGVIMGTDTAATTATINSTGATNVVGQLQLSGTVATMTGLTINAATSLTVSGATPGTDVGIKGWLLNGTANTITISGAASTVPSGQNSAVSIDLLDAEVDVVNASGLTAGGVSLKIGAVTQTITGGAGNDTITTNGALTTGSVNAGTGTGDRLIVSNAADIATTTGAKYTNFEILRNTGGGATLDVSTVAGITAIELGATGQGATGMSAAQAAAVTNLANNDTLTLALASATGTTDVLSVTLANIGTATTSSDLKAATVSGFETMNVVSSAGSFTDVSELAFAAAANLTSLTLTGAKPVLVTTTGLSTKAITIDASGLTAVGATATQYTFETIGNTLLKGSSVIGSGAVDKITTRTSAVTGTSGEYVTYSAGAGNDLLVSTVAAINNTSAANASVKIDGGTGTDTLETDIGTYVDANFQYLTNIEALTFTGTGALNVITGGFFDTNFKSNTPTTIVAATLGVTGGGAATANVLNLDTFSGNVTATLTQAAVADAAVTDSFGITTGSGADIISLTTTEALTSTTANFINTGLGNDTVTITAAALNAAGSISVNLGAGTDIFTAAYAGAGLLNLTGGTGADNITYSTGHTAGAFNANQGTGASGTFAAPATNTISTTTFDLFTGVKDLDTVTLSAYSAGTAFVTTINTSNNLATAVYADNTATAIRGTYDVAANTFVGSSTGADLMVVYDSTASSTITYEAIVLVGQTALASVSSAGLITV